MAADAAPRVPPRPPPGRPSGLWGGSESRRLKRALDVACGHYDHVLVDCGPTLGMLAVNAVVACPDVLVPIELAHAAAMGAVTLRRFLDDVRLELEPAVRIFGVLGTFADRRERTPALVHGALSEVFGGALFDTVVHTSAAVRDAAGQGRPVVLDAPGSRGAAEYRALTQEVINRGEHTGSGIGGERERGADAAVGEVRERLGAAGGD